MTHGISLIHLDERDGGGGRLGRHVEHDSRSLLYQVDPTGVAIVTTLHPRKTPILDQGDLGSCTGNAATGALGCDPLAEEQSPLELDELDEAEAVKLYEAATGLDSFAGTYPPDDTGSTGLAVAKACQAAGLISGYTHATSLNAALAALMSGPVITGVNWYDGFDNPDADGLVAIAGDVRGGHEFVVRGVDVDKQLVHADNSWGASWGDAGSFSFSWDDWTRLLSEQGDVTVFVPNGQPAPTPTPPGPTPTPPPAPGPVTPDAADSALAPFIHRMSVHPFHHVSAADRAAMQAWLADKGL